MQENPVYDTLAPGRHSPFLSRMFRKMPMLGQFTVLFYLRIGIHYVRLYALSISPPSTFLISGLLKSGTSKASTSKTNIGFRHALHLLQAITWEAAQPRSPGVSNNSSRQLAIFHCSINCYSKYGRPPTQWKQVMLLKFRVCTHPQSVACRIWPALGIHIFFLLQMSWPKELAHATSCNIGQGRATPHVNINTVLVTYFQFLAVVHLRPTSPCVEFVGAR